MNKEQLATYVKHTSLLDAMVPTEEKISQQCFNMGMLRIDQKHAKNIYEKYIKNIKKAQLKPKISERVISEFSQDELFFMAEFFHGTVWKKMLKEMVYLDSDQGKKDFKAFIADENDSITIEHIEDAKSYVRTNMSVEVSQHISQFLISMAKNHPREKMITHYVQNMNESNGQVLLMNTGFVMRKLTYNERKELMSFRHHPTFKKLKKVYVDEILSIYTSYFLELERLSAKSSNMKAI